MDTKERDISEINLQDYFPRNLRPMLHTLKIYKKGSHDDSEIAELNVDQHVKMSVKYNDESDSLISIKITSADKSIL
jgi:hypothetical protein